MARPRPIPKWIEEFPPPNALRRVWAVRPNRTTESTPSLRTVDVYPRMAWPRESKRRIGSAAAAQREWDRPMAIRIPPALSAHDRSKRRSSKVHGGLTHLLTKPKQ